jgi:hypothetical protein
VTSGEVLRPDEAFDAARAAGDIGPGRHHEFDLGQGGGGKLAVQFRQGRGVRRRAGERHGEMFHAGVVTDQHDASGRIRGATGSIAVERPITTGVFCLPRSLSSREM